MQFPCWPLQEENPLVVQFATPMLVHAGDKPFSCAVCPLTHTWGKPFSCTVCMLAHEGGNPLVVQLTPTWEKPFSCAVSMLTTTGGKPFSCTVCDKGCSGRSDSKDSQRAIEGKNLLVAQFVTKVVVKLMHCGYTSRIMLGRKAL